MTRISLTEQYDDRDVIAQIVRLKQGLEDASGGIISDIDIVGSALEITWANGESISLPLPAPADITSITGSVSAGNLTITINLSDGSSHTVSTPLTGMATETYVDALDAQNVKITGAQTIAGVKTFSSSPAVPDTPGTVHSAVNQDWVENVAYQDDTVNNLVHKENPEYIKGNKTFQGTITSENRVLAWGGFQHRTGIEVSPTPPATVQNIDSINILGTVGTNEYYQIGIIRIVIKTTGSVVLVARLRRSDGTFHNYKIADSDDADTWS